MVEVLAGGRNPVVTGTAGAHDLQVVHGDRRRPLGAVVAVFTDIRRIDMGRVLARGSRAVVARAACADDLHVVDGVRGRPGHVVVAVLADVRRIQVGQRILARRADAVMTACTVVEDIVVIEIGG